MRIQILFITVTVLLLPSLLLAGEKKVIAKGSTSGHLMENTLPALILAAAMEADYIQQDLVMTKDDHLIVFRDIYLDELTNVKDLFPDRTREDGRYYAIDFTLSEIRQLSLHGLDEFSPATGLPSTGNVVPVFRIPTFEEELYVIRNLEKILKRAIGISPEIKKPWFHAKEGKDITLAVLNTLSKFEYGQENNQILLQCFDHGELKRIKEDLFPTMNINCKLIQLIDHNDGEETMLVNGKRWAPYNYDWMFSKFGIKALSLVVDGLGLEKSILVDEAGRKYHTDLVKNAHAVGLRVYAYSFTNHPDKLPPYVNNFEELISHFLFTVDVDGIFTNNCGNVVSFLKNRPDGNLPSEDNPGASRVVINNGPLQPPQESTQQPPSYNKQSLIPPEKTDNGYTHQ